jgi:hypothetical protein
VIAVLALLTYAILPNEHQSALDPNIYLARNQGFCSSGAWPSAPPALQTPSWLKQWGSWCGGGDQNTGSAETSTFPAPARFAIYLAGYLPESGLSLEIENLNKHSKLPVIPTFTAGDQWYRCEIQLPVAWRGDPVRLIAQDNSTQFKRWFAFSEPVASNGTVIGLREGAQLFRRTVLYFSLTLIPCLAFGAFAIRKGLRDVVLAGTAQLAGLGVCGYLSFWLWFLGRTPGHLFSLLLPILTGAWFVSEYRQLDHGGRRILKRLLTPLALVGAVSLLIVGDGFLHDQLESPFYAAARRYSELLPLDNAVPYMFAEAIRDQHVPRPLFVDFLSSDRPPLQTGLVLSQYAYLNQPRKLGYTVHGVIVQSLWIFAAWLLLTAFALDRRAVALALTVCLFSGFVFLNTFYVWPKLLAATYILAALALVVTAKSGALKEGRIAPILLGSLIALSMLSHGGSDFAILGAVLTVAFLRIRIPLKSLLLMAIAVAVLYVPWTLYQKFYDPPGDRLTKMHLAHVGIYGPDPRSFGAALIDAYKAVTPRQIVANKVANVKVMFAASGTFWAELPQLITGIGQPESRTIAASIRRWMYRGFVICLGFLITGPPALLIGIARRYRTGEWRAAAIFWMFTGLTLAVWCLLLFGPGPHGYEGCGSVGPCAAPLIHQGTYATVLLGYIGSILALWAVSPRVAVVAGCCQVLLNVLLYIVLLRPAAAGTLFAESPTLLSCQLLAALSFVCVSWLLIKLSRDTDSKSRDVEESTTGEQSTRQLSRTKRHSGARSGRRRPAHVQAQQTPA